MLDLDPFMISDTDMVPPRSTLFTTAAAFLRTNKVRARTSTVSNYVAQHASPKGHPTWPYWNRPTTNEPAWHGRELFGLPRKTGRIVHVHS